MTGKIYNKQVVVEDFKKSEIRVFENSKIVAECYNLDLNTLNGFLNHNLQYKRKTIRVYYLTQYAQFKEELALYNSKEKVKERKLLLKKEAEKERDRLFLEKIAIKRKKLEEKEE